jgi:hypothetical protein
MDPTGKPHEGWMTLVPLTVFIFIVVVALGGPESFANYVGTWTVDILRFIGSWFRRL